MLERDGPLERKGGTEVRSAIGIDPDSTGFVCIQVKVEQTELTRKAFLATEKDVQSFIRWLKGLGDVIVAIEGSNGQSKPIEKALRAAGMVFYSFKPADTDKFRKAVLGQNKNNEKDAESVARYALAMEAQGKLERYRRVWFADAELQLLTRCYERISKQITAEVNWLWKLLRYASPDLYLAFRGTHPEVELGEKALKSTGFLRLLAAKPDAGEWKDLSNEQLRDIMGPHSSRLIVVELRKIMDSFPPVSPALALAIGTSARKLQRMSEESTDMTKMLDAITQPNLAVHALKQIRGIGTITASTMIAEIIDIRFAREDNLAGYTGLGLREYSTGNATRMITSEIFNHRLKDAFMTAARNYVLFNPESHLAGYHRNLRKAGMPPMEATKRVARALVRVIFKLLASLLDSATDVSSRKEETAGESDMASGVTRGDRSRISDMSLSSLHESVTLKPKRIKRNQETLQPKGVKKRKIPVKISSRPCSGRSGSAALRRAAPPHGPSALLASGPRRIRTAR